eukprot:m.34981 g.34981  ORF g.34981 m.34981 type:complete len:311 (-) comp5700_c0_seq1:2382-3314(-)
MGSCWGWGWLVLAAAVAVAANPARDIVAAASTTSREPLRVLIAAEGRSGSSFLLELLARLPQSFGYFEPFKPFFEAGATGVLTLDALYDCLKDVSSDQQRRVFWSEACIMPHRGPWFGADTMRRCLAGNMTAEDLAAHEQACHASRIRTVKSVRVHEELLRALAAMDSPPLVVHLMRNPLAVAVSWARLGWYGGRPADIVQHICSGYREKMDLEDRLPAGHYIACRSEDLFSAPLAALGRVLSMLGEPLDADTHAHLEHYIATVASGHERHFQRRAAVPDAVQGELASRLAAACPDIFAALDYPPPSHLT